MSPISTSPVWEGLSPSPDELIDASSRAEGSRYPTVWRVVRQPSWLQQLVHELLAVPGDRAPEPALRIDLRIARIEAFVEPGARAELAAGHVPGELHELQAPPGVDARPDQPFVHQGADLGVGVIGAGHGEHARPRGEPQHVGRLGVGVGKEEVDGRAAADADRLRLADAVAFDLEFSAREGFRPPYSFGDRARAD